MPKFTLEYGVEPKEAGRKAVAAPLDAVLWIQDILRRLNFDHRSIASAANSAMTGKKLSR